MVRRRLTWCCALLLLTCIRCTEVEGPATDGTVKTLEGLIVSESRAAAAASASTASGVQIGVTYVSLASGSQPLALSVQIRNGTTGVAAARPAPIINGGFDPVAIQASVGDLLELTVNQLNGTVEIFSARVPPRRPPTIVRTNPPKGRTDVALTIRPAVIFSEPVDPTTLSTTSVRLLQGTTPVSGTVALEPGVAWAVEFTPASALEPNTTYALMVTRDIRDLEGDTLDATITTTFTTSAGNPASDPRIAFTSNRDGSSYIYVASADGSRVVQLIPGEKPAWSWDGRRIAFQRAGVIHVMNADGSDLTLLRQGWDPAWSPDGTRIAFGQEGGIYEMNADGSGVTMLLNSEFENVGDEVRSLTWSPDGRFIAFVRVTPYYGGQIYIMNADGSQPRPLIYGEEPSWSPNGSTIAFENYYGIAAVNVDGSFLRNVLLRVSALWDPDWSPDGRQLVFHQFKGLPVVGSPFGSSMRIYVARIADGSIQQLIPDAVPAMLGSYRDHQAVWSRVNR